MEIFQYRNYKQLLKAQVAAHKDVYAYKTKLAQAAGCQNSFLSHVLNSHVHLTPEHGLGLSRFWGFSAIETEYFLELVNLARAGTKELQDLISKRLKKISTGRAHEKMPVNSADIQNDQDFALYYSDWHYVAIDLLLSQPDFQTEARLCQRLGLPLETVQSALEYLEKLGLAQKSGSKWSSTSGGEISLSADSPLRCFNHALWRQKAIASAFAKQQESLHHTTVTLMSNADYLDLKRLIGTFVGKTKASIEKSQLDDETDLVCINFDLFRF